MYKSFIELSVPNGLTFSVVDQSRRYFGDFHHLKVLITGTIPLDLIYFCNENQRAEAELMLGSGLTYRRYVEKMGVPSEEVEPVLHELISNFEKHSLPYFNSPRFLQKLLQVELEKMQKKKPVRCFKYE